MSRQGAHGAPRKLELVFLLFEQHVEGGHRAVTAGKVLLHLNCLTVSQFFLTVYFLFQNAKPVVPAHNSVKQNFLRLQRRIGRMQHHSAFVPAKARLLDHRIRLAQAELAQGGVSRLLNKCWSGISRPVTLAWAWTGSSPAVSGASVHMTSSK